MPSRQRLAYRTCSIKELIKFITDRSHTAPPTNRNKDFYISRLKELDKQWRFRFLDLSGEMRNLIYSYLLTIDEDKGFCWPQIIASSKQVHRETAGLLYSLSTVTFTIQSDVVYEDFESDFEDSEDLGQVTLAYFIGNKQLPDPFDEEFMETSGLLPRYLVALPQDILRKVIKLQIQVHIGTNDGSGEQWDNEEFVPINNSLYGLCNVLETCSQLREVELQVTTDPEEDYPDELERLLYPITRLSSLTVNFTGLPQEVEQSLSQRMGGGAPGPQAPLQNLMVLNEGIEEAYEMSKETGQIHPILDVLHMRLEPAILENADVVDHELDQEICRMAASLQIVWDGCETVVKQLREDVLAKKLEKAKLEEKDG